MAGGGHEFSDRFIQAVGQVHAHPVLDTQAYGEGHGHVEDQGHGIGQHRAYPLQRRRTRAASGASASRMMSRARKWRLRMLRSRYSMFALRVPLTVIMALLTGMIGVARQAIGEKAATSGCLI